MARSALSVPALVALSLTAAAAAQPCATRWTNDTPPPDIAGSAYCMIEFDDDGPAGPHPAELYVGGLFDTVSGQTVGNIAKWNGTSWSPVGGGTDGSVFAMVVFDDDGPGPHLPALYIAGNFAMAGGVAAEGVARWDGVSWSPVGAGLSGGSGGPRTLAVFDDDGPGPDAPALYAGGYFGQSGQTTIQYIARWTGSAWSPVGSGVDGGVLAMAVYDEDGPGPIPGRLYVGGGFVTAGGITTVGIARWDGAAWSGVAGGFPGSPAGTVSALAVFDEDGPGPVLPVLFAGGTFTQTAGAPVMNIARWDGGDWTDVGGGVSGGAAPTVTSLVVLDGSSGGAQPGLYVAGRFTTAGAATPASNIARWNGSAWSALGSGVDSANALVYSLAQSGPDGGAKTIFVGGDMTSCGGVPVSSIAQWNGLAWSGLSVDMRVSGTVLAMAAIDDDGPGPAGPALYLGGDFTRIGGVPNSNLVRKDGAVWSSVGGGANGAVRTICQMPGAGQILGAPGIVIGGSFTSAGAVTASHIAFWNGAAWSAIGAGVDGDVYAAVLFDPDGLGPTPPSLVIGGAFMTSGSTTLGHLARWDGQAWQPIGGGVAGGNVNALLVFDPDGPGPIPPVLIAGGDFTSAGGVAVNHIALWDGATWSNMAGGISGGDGPVVDALCVLDEAPFGVDRRVVIAGGRFATAGGQVAGRIARWDGSGWSAVGGGLPGSFSEVRALAVYDDDGPGPGVHALYAAGNIQTPGRWISRWNGTTWGAVGPGVGGSQPILAIASMDRDRAGPIAPALLAGGALGLRTWSACDAACAGDFDRNGLVQPADVTLFVGTWLADLFSGGSRADMDNNGTVEPQDVASFVRQWFQNVNGGCQ